MKINWSPKGPTEDDLFYVDWTARLGTDTIATSAFVMVSPAGLTKGTEDKTTTRTSVELSGGTPGGLALLRNDITTAAGRDLSWDIELPIKPVATIQPIGSAYLSPVDYGAYGVPRATPGQVASASAVVDAFLQRPEGMVWAPDAAGQPCYMAAMQPMFTLTASGAISAGVNVPVPCAGGMISPDLVGEVLILDRGVAGKTEACIVSAIAAGSFTLAQVAYSHGAGAAMDAGLTILEERALPANRNVSRVTRTPVARLLSGVGRYSYGRRSQQIAGDFQPNLIGTLQAFGAPVWTPFNVADCSLSQGTGEVWIPAGIVGAYFTDVRFRYVAGYSYTGLPIALKQAVATIVSNAQRFPELAGDIKRIAAGGTTIERFSDNLLDAQTRGLLTPFLAKVYY